MRPATIIGRSLIAGALMLRFEIAAAQLPPAGKTAAEFAVGAGTGALAGLAGVELGWRLDKAGKTPKWEGTFWLGATGVALGTALGVDRIGSAQGVPSNYGKAVLGASAGVGAFVAATQLQRRLEPRGTNPLWLASLLLPSIGATLAYNVARRH